MKKQYLLLLSTLLLLPTTFNDNNYVAKADSISTDDNSALVTVAHIRNNLDEFNDERAAAGYLTAVNSFTLMSITIDSYEETGIAGFLLDFDSDKGYMVVGPNMRYYDLSFTGNSPVPSGNNIQRFYSDYLGYYYIDSNNVKVEIGFPNAPDVETNESYVLMDGQMAAGESLITDVQAYNDDKYGTEFIYTDEHTIFDVINMPGYMDMHLTFYYIWDGVQMTYPDMDGYTAGFSVGKYIAHATYTGSYNNENQFIPYTPANNETTNYNNMVARGFTPLNSRTVSQYEAAYRAKVINLYGSEEDLTVNEVVQVLGNMYGSKISYTSWTENHFAISDMDMLDENKPVIFEFNNSYYYGERIVVVCGYKLYTKTRTILGITKIDLRFYLEYKDGTTKEQSMWFDFNICANRIGAIYSITIN